MAGSTYSTLAAMLNYIITLHLWLPKQVAFAVHIPWSHESYPGGVHWDDFNSALWNSPGLLQTGSVVVASGGYAAGGVLFLGYAAEQVVDILRVS
eukprot:3803259-Amphidinium_carterae.3